MRPHINLYVSRFPRWLSCLANRNSSGESLGGSPHLSEAHTGRRALVLAAAVFALPLASGRLHAQQAPDPWPTDDPNEGAYSNQPQPAQQYGYGQPQYTQPYAQPYPQPAYPSQQVYADPYQAYPQQGYQQPQPQGFSAERLEQMVAPIALYPDNLVSIVLAASTYPAQVSAADQWLRMQGYALPEQIAAGADAQTSWDPSVKALTAFPQVLDQLANNLQWTADLGNAYYNQPQDVMQTIQVMRARAQAAGNLQSTPQEQVTVDQGNIELAPPSPQMVYVPQYNPWAVYGQPVQQYPGYDWLGAVGSFIGNALVQWGPGIAMQAFATTPFGWIGWGLDWLAHAILFHHSDYYTHSYEVRDWGFPHGGPRGFRGWDRPGFHDGRGWGREQFLSAGNNRGYNRGLGRESGRFVSDRQRFGNDRSAGGYRGYGNTWARSGSQQAYNHGPQPAGGSFAYSGRPQAGVQRNYGSVYGSGYKSGSNGSGYGSGSNNAYSSGMYGRGNGYPSYPGRSGSFSSPAYRSPVSPYRGDQGSRSNFSYAQPRSGIGNEHASGGFHLFGGGHPSNSFGSYKAPRSSSLGGGHSGWASGGGYKAPKASHFSGGGGGYFSGGHSGGGGHSSKHH